MRLVFTSLSEIENSSWEVARTLLVEDLQRAQSTANRSFEVSHHADGTQKAPSRGVLLGQLTGTLAEQPTGLSIENDGLLYFVTDYGHMVRWNGSLTKWEFAPGDPGTGFFQSFAITPQSTGWALADGNATTYLVVGGPTLTTANFTPPNLSGGIFLKGGTYTGSTVSAVAPGVGLSGSTDAESSHTHSTIGATNGSSADIAVDRNLDGSTHNVFDGGSHAHTLNIATTGGSAHSHGITGIVVTPDTAARPPSLAAPIYFRR